MGPNFGHVVCEVCREGIAISTSMEMGISYSQCRRCVNLNAIPVEIFQIMKAHFINPSLFGEPKTFKKGRYWTYNEWLLQEG